jgi:predicted nucleotidyltransferase
MSNFNNKWREFLEESELNKSGLMIQSRLHPKFWFKRELNSKIRRKLLKIAEDVAENLQLSDFVDDIIITGSIAAYNWHTLSDIDLHILLDFSKVDKNTSLVKRYLDSQKTLWNKNHDIMINDHEVEIYFQDSSEDHESAGIYSVLMGNWIKKPVKEKVKMDILAAEKKADSINNEIITLQELFGKKKYRIVYGLSEKLKGKIKVMRQSGLSKEGIYSPENLAFKILRNNGLLEILSTLRTLSYDKLMSTGDVKIKIG